MGGWTEMPTSEFRLMQGALMLAVRILARDGLRPLEGLAYTATEREENERATQLTVAELRGKPKPDRVEFRVFTQEWGEEVGAIFPDFTSGELVMTYFHVAQHGYGHHEHMRSHSRPAKPVEYAPLFAELRRIGYNPVPVTDNTEENAP